MEASGAFDRDPSRRRKDPETTGALGRAPKHLQPDRIKIWKELAKVLPVGVGRNSDRLAFEVLVELTFQFRHGTLTGAQLGNMTSLISKFGGEPASRTRVAQPVSTKVDGSNPFTSFL